MSNTVKFVASVAIENHPGKPSEPTAYTILVSDSSKVGMRHYQTLSQPESPADSEGDFYAGDDKAAVEGLIRKWHPSAKWFQVVEQPPADRLQRMEPRQ
jgi:hypothetical protein